MGKSDIFIHSKVTRNTSHSSLTLLSGSFHVCCNENHICSVYDSVSKTHKLEGAFFEGIYKYRAIKQNVKREYLTE